MLWTCKGFEASYVVREKGMLLLDVSFLCTQIQAAVAGTEAVQFCSLEKEQWLPYGK